MANKTLFQSLVARPVPATDDHNLAGAPAYRFTARHALAQYAATGCLNATFYASAETQLSDVLRLCDQVSPETVAKTALYARTQARMKDLPALLVAYLSVQDAALCERVFDRVIDDGKMLRNFVQIVRSGVVGRKSLGSLPKRLVRRWFATRSGVQIFRASVGQAPSLADVIKLAHPRPQGLHGLAHAGTDVGAAHEARQALYGYLLGRNVDAHKLPEEVQAFEAYKAGRTGQVPRVPFQMLTALPLGTAEWVTIARNASFQETRMNLNTFARHGVFTKKGLVDLVADRLRQRQQIVESGVLPYQLMMARVALDAAVPAKVASALEDALDVSLSNVPALRGKVYVCPDVSGSMSSPVTGVRQGATSKVRCIDVAALLAAAMMRRNDAEVLPFEQCVVTSLRLNARDRVMANATKLAAICGGGTACSAPLAELNRRGACGDAVIFVSDNESWVDVHGARSTQMMQEWRLFKDRNPQAKLICIDIQPSRTTQAGDAQDILNVGGFSDAVFDVIDAFVRHGSDGRHWADVIDQVAL